jgi:hypothetical protein
MTAILVSFLQALEAHAPALTPVVVAACFGLFMLQLKKWRPSFVRGLGLLEAIASHMGLTVQEEEQGEKKADALAPNGMTWSEILDQLSATAIERDNALRDLADLKKLLTPPATVPAPNGLSAAGETAPAGPSPRPSP